MKNLLLSVVMDMESNEKKNANLFPVLRPGGPRKSSNVLEGLPFIPSNSFYFNLNFAEAFAKSAREPILKNDLQASFILKG